MGAGAAVALRCSPALPGARCLLYLEGQSRALDVLSQHQEAFSIPQAREGDGGRYSCQCFTQAGAIFNWSAASQPLELVVRGETLPGRILLCSSPPQRLPHLGGTGKEDAGAGRSCRRGSAASLSSVRAVPAPQKALQMPCSPRRARLSSGVPWPLSPTACTPQLPQPCILGQPSAGGWQWQGRAGSVFLSSPLALMPLGGAEPVPAGRGVAATGCDCGTLGHGSVARVVLG